MPSSSDKMRALMTDWFGDISDGPPTSFLIQRGYTLRKDWHWDPPVSQHSPNYPECMCIQFLIDEWDFGGLVRPDNYYL